MSAPPHGNVKSGWKIFPVVGGAKTPLTENGFRDASNDPAQIAQWTTAYPDCNWAVSCGDSGLLVVDIDGPVGEATWAALEFANEITPTYEVQTPRGGRHLYFEGAAPTSVQKLGPKVDVRSTGGYVLLPGSVVYDKPYVALNSAPIPAAAPWLVTLCGQRRDADRAAVANMDMPGNIARAVSFLERRAGAKQGEGADSWTYETACFVLNLGVSPEKAHELMMEIYAPKCEPYDDRMEAFIERKIENASAYAQNEAGAWAVEPAGVAFAGAALDKLLAESAARPAPQRRFKLWTLEERANLPPPAWLIQDMIPDKAVTMLYGPGGGGKTFVALRLGLDLAKAGKRVAYVMGEGGTGPDQRAAAWRIVEDHRGPLPFAIMDNMPAAIDGEATREALEDLEEFKPDLLIFDTVAWFSVGYNENDASEMMKVVAALNGYARHLDCAVLAIHHTGKDASRGARGSDALLFGINASLEAQLDEPTKTIAMYARRQKDAEIRKEPWCYELRVVGQSAVAIPISAKERRARTAVDNLASPSRVGRALRQMGALSADSAVTSHVVASHLLQNSTDVPGSPELLDLQSRELSGRLDRAAKWNLAPYCQGEAGARRWWVPTGMDEAASH